MGYKPITITDEEKAALETEHEDVLILKGPEKAPWIVAMRRPTRQETLGYKAHAKRDETTANEQLIRKITVFPIGEPMEKQLARWPFLPDGIAAASAFKDFLGITVDHDVK